MKKKIKIIFALSALILAGVLGSSLLAFFYGVGPLGTWQGELDTGLARFRIALILQRDPDGKSIAVFNNIDDGIYNQPFKKFYFRNKFFHGELATGEVLDLSVNWLGFGSKLVGTYRQAHGSFQREGMVSRLELRVGRGYLEPRVGPDGHFVTEEPYQLPRKMSDGWEVGSAAGDVEGLKKIKIGIAGILKEDFPHIHSLLVVKKGKLVLDEYFYGYGPEEKHPIQSVTKSVFSLLFGVAQDQGLVFIGQKLFSYFPEYRSRPGWDSREDQISLGMLLTMRSGVACDDWQNSKVCSWDMVNSPDWLNFSLSLPLGNLPGKHFAYCGACLTPLSAILAAKSGMGVPGFAEKYLFGPLGIKDVEWMEGPGSVTPVSFGLSLRPRDLAKLGQLILNQGKWNGAQVISKDWIKRSTSVQVRRNQKKGEADYGFLWWIRAFPAGGKNIRVIDGWGVGGNHLFIVPDLDLVCVITAGNYKDGKLGAESLEFFKNYILGMS